jgi:hypothetical protein
MESKKVKKVKKVKKESSKVQRNIYSMSHPRDKKLYQSKLSKIQAYSTDHTLKLLLKVFA